MDTSNTLSSGRKWWHGASVYHIYPRSFYDANGDGIGDLKGIIKKLDYLNGKPDSLGVNAIWISPFYPSPMADFGYDVSDYCDVDPLFGTLRDIEVLVEEAHKRDIRVIIDFVPNHSSKNHPWFKDSSSSIDNPKRDWYIWKNPQPDGSPPNNWKSVFGGSAWELDKKTNQYYLHTFLASQPDLNWDNPEVREEMKRAIRFWLDMGVDGLRVDAVSWLSKDQKFRDDPMNPNYREGIDDPYHTVVHSFSSLGQHLFDYLNEIIDTAGEYSDRFVITEAYPDSPGDINHYLHFYGKIRLDICAPFNFECHRLPWDASTYRGFIDMYQQALLPGQPAVYNMGNHDKTRLATRIGKESARTAAMMLMTLPGMPFIYYGDELGMEDVVVPKEKVKDPFAAPDGTGRDVVRTPMQWNGTHNGGFSNKEPWLPLSKDFRALNTDTQDKDEKSLLNLYKRLLRLRNNVRTMKFGSYWSLSLGDNIYGFVRENDMERYLVILNFSNQDTVAVSKAIRGVIRLSTYMDKKQYERVYGGVKLRPHEGLIIEAV
jgi:alpha-glucosidase